MLSFAAVIGGDVMALQTAKQCCRELTSATAPADKPPPDVRHWALVLGAVHRTVGGIVLRTCLAEIVTGLMAYAKNDAIARSSPGAAVFALHALFLVMSSAFGPSRWVELVLETALECLLRSGDAEAGLRPAAAAVVTAIVEVQGPEFCPACKTTPVAECARRSTSCQDGRA